VPRRLLPPVLAGLALVLTAGCADQVSPALRVDDATVANDELLDEVAEWAGNEAILTAVQFPAELVEGEAPGSYSTELVTFVLGTRIGFELHRIELADRDLEVTDQQRETVRAQLFADPAQTEAVLSEFSADYGDRLVDDVAGQIALQDELGEDYEPWLTDAYASADVEVNPRYGMWDEATQQVAPPEGPVQRGADPDPLTAP
jgi:hypothetical protein